MNVSVAQIEKNYKMEITCLKICKAKKLFRITNNKKNNMKIIITKTNVQIYPLLKKLPFLNYHMTVLPNNKPIREIQ